MSLSFTDMLTDLIADASREYRERRGFPIEPSILADRILDADFFREHMANVWDAGFDAGVNHDLGDWEVAPEPVVNPYRKND